jgi:hypothetical protein
MSDGRMIFPPHSLGSSMAQSPGGLATVTPRSKRMGEAADRKNDRSRNIRATTPVQVTTRRWTVDRGPWTVDEDEDEDEQTTIFSVGEN